MMIETPAWYWKAEPCSHTLCEMSGDSCCQFSGRRWDQTAEFLAAPHSLLQCNGRCGQPFHTVAAIQMAWANTVGAGWGDLALIWDEEEAAMETPEQTAAKALAKAKQQEEDAKEAKAARCFNFLRETESKHSCKGHQQKPKLQQPCKYLYCTPGVEGRYERHLTGEECWGYQYHCPKTGELLKAKPGKECKHLHPGEAGWLAQWNTDRYYKPAGAQQPPTRDFGALKSGNDGWTAASHNKRR
jgi:hypothetical protein